MSCGGVEHLDPRPLDHGHGLSRGLVRQALGDQDGDVLVFLPGAREVDEVVRRLAGLPGYPCTRRTPTPVSP